MFESFSMDIGLVDILWQEYLLEKNIADTPK
jgi:hypothetical protein